MSDEYDKEPSRFSQAKAVFDAVAERLIGMSGVAAAATEWINPQLLSIDGNFATGLGVFGFFLATGRADAAANIIAKRIKKAFSDD